jgi:hypothetical protein
MKTRHIQPPSSPLSVSQQFLLGLGYEEHVSAEAAVCWHYQALKRRNAFRRHEDGTETPIPNSEGFDLLEKRDHEEIVLELGLDPFRFTREKLNLPLPERLDALLWDWAL